MESCKKASTSISTSCYLDTDEKEAIMDQTKFRGLIESLLYLTASRPGIMFSYACVLDFKLIQRSLTTMLQRGFLSMSKELQMWDYGTQMKLHSKLRDIQIQIS